MRLLVKNACFARGVARFASLLCLCVTLFGQQAWANPAVAGQVIFVIGDARLAADALQTGSVRKLDKNDRVLVGQTIETGANGHVHLRMVDDAYLSVRPNSRLRIEAYDYDAARAQDSRVKYTLEEGAARSITGKAGQANKPGFRMNTPVAAIAIRGTDFVVTTTRETTRASVSSGAIAVSGFDESCRPDGFGACGKNVLELAAGALTSRMGYLEVRAQQKMPVLVPANGDGSPAANFPNKAAPAHAEESRLPSASTTQEGRAPTSTSVSEVVTDSVAYGIAATAANQTPATVFWGRWSAYDGGSVARPDATARLAEADKQLTGVSTVFALLREKGEVSLPATGRFDFRLVDSEAYLQRGAQLAPASVSNGALGIDFAARKFSTALTFSSSSLAAPLALRADGVVNADGTFVQTGGNTQITGVLSRDTAQAGYLFQSTVTSMHNAVGATRWQR